MRGSAMRRGLPLIENLLGRRTKIAIGVDENLQWDQVEEPR